MDLIILGYLIWIDKYNIWNNYFDMNATLVDTTLTISVIVWLIFNLSCGFLTFVKRKISLENLWILTGISTLILLSIIKLIGWI